MPYRHLIRVHVGHVPVHKLKNASKGGKLSLTAEELGGHTHTIHVHPEVAEKLLKAKHAHRGARFHHTHHEIMADLHHHRTHYGHTGGSLWSWIKDHGSQILDSAAAVGKVLAPEFSGVIDTARDVARTWTGKGMAKSHPAKKSHAKKSHAKKGRPAKGSAEAKARMAKVRNAKRTGGSFLPAGGYR